MVFGAIRGLRELLMVLLSAASSLRRHRSAAATHGQTGGRAMLVAKISASSFLYERIFGSDKVTLMPPAQPSCFVPGWD
jgi:hypothetical protein